jgi:WD40 repeat protein
MSRKHLRLGVLLVSAALVLSAAVAQQTSKPPSLPPINPAAARLDATATGLDGPGSALAVNERLGLVAAGCEKGSIHFWDRDVILGIRAGGRTAHVLPAHKGSVLALAWNGNGRLASAGADRKVVLWNLDEGKPKYTIAAATTIRCLALSSDGKLLAGGGDDAVVHLWDTDTGKPARTDAGPLVFKGHTDWVVSLAFNSDNKVLASGGYDGMVRLWDLSARKKLLDFSAQPPPQPNTATEPAPTVSALAFTPDDKQLALGNTESQIYFFNVEDGKYLRTLAGHTSAVTALVFHPAGAVLVSASKDGSVRLWTPSNGQALKTLEGHTAWVQGVALVEQGTRLASVGADETVRFWDLTNPPAR